MKRRTMFIVLGGLAILIAAVVVGNHFHEERLAEEDVKINARNDEVRFYPDDLECAPTFKGFNTALQRALNATVVHAHIYVDAKEPTKVHLDNDLEGSSRCDRDILRYVHQDERVGRLLRRCGITYLDCVRSDAAIEITRQESR